MWSLSCRGKRKGKTWYGVDWRKPSSGWKANEANGVGTVATVRGICRDLTRTTY